MEPLCTCRVLQLLQSQGVPFPLLQEAQKRSAHTWLLLRLVNCGGNAMSDTRNCPYGAYAPYIVTSQ